MEGEGKSFAATKRRFLGWGGAGGRKGRSVSEGGVMRTEGGLGGTEGLIFPGAFWRRGRAEGELAGSVSTRRFFAAGDPPERWAGRRGSPRACSASARLTGLAEGGLEAHRSLAGPTAGLIGSEIPRPGYPPCDSAAAGASSFVLGTGNASSSSLAAARSEAINDLGGSLGRR